MPREHKAKRGRREEKKEEKKLKRKREKGEDDPPRQKKQKSQDQDPAEDTDVEITGLDNDYIPLVDEEEGGATERPFYGMLEDEEQEYFRHADELLELNDFPSEEERSLFLENVYREAEGKELKIACSQSCSRLMERLILLSSAEQKKKLFEKFAGNFAHLVQHRFASHCCETLFIQSAPIVTEELTADSKKKEAVEEKDVVSMESLFLQTLDELEGKMTFLLTDRFASHTLRVLLVVLSGRALEQASTRSLLQSKKKEKISITGLDSSPTELTLSKRSVPSSFQFAVEKIISDTIATMDTSFIRILATHPTGNPTLQLLLELELTNPNTKKGTNTSEKTIISALLPDNIEEEGSESATFVNGILYDAIGSRLLETICTFAPGKLFKSLYRSTFKSRLGALARNEISSYPTIRVLNRLSKEDLEEAIEQIIPQLEGLVQRSRTTVIKTLFERSAARGADTTALTAALATAYGDDPSVIILKIASIDDLASLLATVFPPVPPSSTDDSKPPTRPPAPLKPSPPQLHGSLLAQTLLSISGPPSELMQTGLLALPPQTLLALALYQTTTHILQSALQPSPTNTPFRRKLINALLFPPSSTSPRDNPILTLALSPTGSHVLDALLLSTSTPSNLFSLTERIASTLTTSEALLRDSFTGRIVWRNWSLDLFKRRRGEWVNTIKASASAQSASLTSVQQPTPAEAEDEENGKEKKSKKPKKNAKDGKGKSAKGKPDQNPKAKANTDGKSAIQLAREKFAAAKAEKLAGITSTSRPSFKNASVKGRGTGANAT
ncbi:ARM repeat-containing protein [Stipitochalara longipes BDJ]|nr:ARM repeat-containing protein [Stipitochalara longipes BDJ]